ncbi:MAG: 2-octaprenyl-6-methoxyphenyl hydroxylase [Gammaproteobacteria bacterium]|nr:2-octaprenyl-6-methoxyphenyl hydroxylase [Gammaproteobacteria bacterium]
MTAHTAVRDEYDICIVGGGMVGASMALALAPGRASIALIEAVAPQSDDQPSYDQRGLALSLSSRRILEHLDVWDSVSLAAHPIRRVHVSRQGRFGRVQLDARMLGLDALGHVVLARCLGEALFQALRGRASVDLVCPGRVRDAASGAEGVRLEVDTGDGLRQMRCRLMVVADGTHSSVRGLLGMGTQVRDYRQTALVGIVTPVRHHQDTAYERFAPGGPLALLPMADGHCVAVVCVANAALAEWSALDDDGFLARLDVAWGRRFGGFTRAGPRRSYPLQLMRADAQRGDRVVLLGNAAHTIHPNGAQGFNLGVRDVAGLAEQLNRALREGDDPGDRRVLDAYLHARRADQGRVIGFSDLIATLYSSGWSAASLVGGAGMLLTSMVPPLRRALLLHGTGLYGRQPAWVRGAVTP